MEDTCGGFKGDSPSDMFEGISGCEGRLVGWLVGWLVERLVCWKVGRLTSLLRRLFDVGSLTVSACT